MTLLITIIAAIIATIIWYVNEKRDTYRLGTLSLIYWGASLMWFVDAIFEYAEDGDAFFAPAGADMLNDLFLGFAVVAFGLIIWVISLLIKDPKGVVRAALLRRR